MSLASRIDHTILKAEALPGDVTHLTHEAKEYGFASVCVNGQFTSLVARSLAGSNVQTCAVVGFPLGASKATIKAIEAVAAVKDGAGEIDFVAHLPFLLNGDLASAKAEFLEVVRGARSANPRVVIKVIVESAVLLKDVDDRVGEERIALACQAVRESGCDFIKTSTGFHPAGGACVKAVTWMKKHSQGLYVKASGGIRTYDDAMRMIDAGADRLGCSASVAIVNGSAILDKPAGY
jgi:deoxyribose-phosphate aldolase